MEKMTDELLIETYDKALKLDSDKDFIQLLEQELKRRNLELKKEKA
jgi:developmental checkpoint coupling sporulation initiation to replication initiation